MDIGTGILIIGGIVALAAMLAIFALSAISARKKKRVRGLVSEVLATTSTAQPVRRKAMTEQDIEELKKRSKESKQGQQKFTTVLFRPETSGGDISSLEQGRFFQAGLFSPEDRTFFYRFQIVAPIVCAILGFGFMYLISGFDKIILLVAGAVLGILIGVTLPKSWLQRQVRFRQDETLYYLPLAIEQVSIGVSSSLDLWPCIAHILGMARERGAYNPVTELFIYVEKLIVSGLSFPQALAEVAQASGIQQIKHAFKFLAQCAEHGGEVSKQLQELADSVQQERQVMIEGKIAALPVRATGPLFLVFAGFFILMLAGMFSKLVMSMNLG